MAILSAYTTAAGLPTVPKYTNAVLLAANVPEFFTVPSDENNQLARYVTFSKTTATPVDFYAKAYTTTEDDDRVINGGFATDTDWTKGTGWTIAAGVATATGAISTNLTNVANLQLVQGGLYYVTFTATRSAGSVTINVGGTAGTARSSAATFSELIIAGSTQVIEFTTSGFTGTVDLVSVVPAVAVPADTTLGTAGDLNPTGYFLNSNIATIAVVSAGTPIITANFYK